MFPGLTQVKDFMPNKPGRTDVVGPEIFACFGGYGCWHASDTLTPRLCDVSGFAAPERPATNLSSLPPGNHQTTECAIRPRRSRR